VGDAKFWFPERDKYTKSTEVATVADASDGTFRFSVNHYYDQYFGETGFPTDQKKEAIMLLTVNNREPKSFSHPHNEIAEPRLEDGETNPDYKGTTYIDVTCDSECECDFKERIPGVCEINAVLEFPPFADQYYGYHTDGLTALKRGAGDECGYYYPFTSWGCTSDGEAYIVKYSDDKYTDDELQTLNIVDATDGGYTFTVTHYYANEELYYDTDHKHVAVLDIKVNGVSIGSFNHPRNNNRDTHDEDGNVNPDYKGTVDVGVECDIECNCVAQQLQNNEALE